MTEATTKPWSAAEIGFMGLALDEAQAAAAYGETPVGAVLTSPDGEVVARAGNRPIALNDPTAHAEILCLRAAGEKIGNYRLTGLDLYVTLEPCAMCAAAISFARIRRLIFGACDVKGGAVLHGPRFFEQPTCHWRPDVAAGLLGERSSEMLTAFFRARR